MLCRISFPVDMAGRVYVVVPGLSKESKILLTTACLHPKELCRVELGLLIQNHGPRCILKPFNHSGHLDHRPRINSLRPYEVINQAEDDDCPRH